jgi:peptidyl-prolyl cis-trans isomerase B (cyclophilin B)
MKRFLILVGAAALLLSCNNAARREAAREQARLDSIARAEAVRDSIAAAKKHKRRVKEAEITAASLPEEPVFDIITNLGTIKVRLFKDTPHHRDNFVKLALAGYYDSLLFHRVIKDFMIQGGGMNKFMMEKAAMLDPIKLERSPQVLHKKYAISMARTSDPNSASSQFFICNTDCDFLDGQYAAFGEVIEGIDVVDAISDVATQSVKVYDDVPVEPIMITDVYML